MPRKNTAGNWVDNRNSIFDPVQAQAVLNDAGTWVEPPMPWEPGGSVPTVRDLSMFYVDFTGVEDPKGGIQPDTYNPQGTDNRFFRVSATSTQPNYVPNKSGLFSTTSLNTSTLRRSDRGVWVESQIGNGDNPILWTRDLTQAPWVKTGCTVFKDQPGAVIPAVANSACRIVVDQAGATLLQSTTRSITNPFSWAFVPRRLVGTGTIEYTRDNVNFTLFNPTTDFKQVFDPSQTTLDPIVGWRFGTPGDQFVIDLIRGSKFPYPHTPLIQLGTTAVQWFDRYTSGIAGGTNGAYSSGMMEYLRDNVEWGVFGEWNTAKTGAQFNIFGLLLAVQADGKITCETKGTGGGVTTAAGTARVSTTQHLEKNNRAFAWTIGTITYLCVNGGDILSFPGRTLGTYTALDHKDLGGNGSGTLNVDGPIARWGIVGADKVSQIAAYAKTLTTPVDFIPA